MTNHWIKGIFLSLLALALAACAKDTDLSFRELQVRLPASLCQKYTLTFEETSLDGIGPYLQYTVSDGDAAVGKLSFLRWDQIRAYYEARQDDEDFAAYLMESWQSWTVSRQAAAQWIGILDGEVTDCGDWGGALPGVFVTYQAEGMFQRDLYVVKDEEAYVIHFEATAENLAELLNQVLESVS